MRPTQRSYTEKNTSERYTMYHSDTTGQNVLINDKTGDLEDRFVLSAFSAIDYKLKSGKIISLSQGEFLIPDANDMPTHKKFFIQKRFVKL